MNPHPDLTQAIAYANLMDGILKSVMQQMVNCRDCGRPYPSDGLNLMLPYVCEDCRRIEDETVQESTQ